MDGLLYTKTESWHIQVGLMRCNYMQGSKKADNQAICPKNFVRDSFKTQGVDDRRFCPGGTETPINRQLSLGVAPKASQNVKAKGYNYS